MDIKLENVRLSFPNLFKAKAANKDGTGEPKYGASFLIKKATRGDLIAKIQQAIQKVAEEKWPKGIPQSVRGEKICLRDGTTKDYDGYDASVMFVPASTPVRPLVLNRDKSPLTEADGVIFAGCYVTAVIRLWAQDNEFGKRVNASLRGVQFYADGEPFGEKPLTPEAFDNLGDAPASTAEEPHDAAEYADEQAATRKPGNSMF